MKNARCAPAMTAFYIGKDKTQLEITFIANTATLYLSLLDFSYVQKKKKKYTINMKTIRRMNATKNSSEDYLPR
ncbi:hypothetical protein A3758_20875 [Oleiphilus sp. HI0118]|nr:hypothetical protein A3758_20875 [Oleiphilus sp. HI0118]